MWGGTTRSLAFYREEMKIFSHNQNEKQWVDAGGWTSSGFMGRKSTNKTRFSVSAVERQGFCMYEEPIQFRLGADFQGDGAYYHPHEPGCNETGQCIRWKPCFFKPSTTANHALSIYVLANKIATRRAELKQKHFYFVFLLLCNFRQIFDLEPILFIYLFEIENKNGERVFRTRLSLYACV